VEHLKRIYEQLKGLYLSMTPGNRILTVLLALVLLVSLGWLIGGSIKPADPQSKYVLVFDGYNFDSKDKIAVQAALSKANLRDHVWLGDQLRVLKSQEATYTAQIAAEKAIRIPGNSSFQTAKDLSPWDSNLSKTAKMFQAKAQDVADSISKLEGIKSAEVLPNTRRDWDRNVWARKDVCTVAVNVETIGYKPLSIETVSAVGGLVSAAFGTDPKLVNIVDGKNNRIYNGGGEEIGGATNYSRAQSSEEEKWTNKIQGLLNIKGLQVATTVILSKDIEKFFKVQHEKPKAQIHEHVRGTDYRNEGGDRYGRPGHEAQMNRPLLDPRVGISGGRLITDKTHEQETTWGIQGIETKGENIPLVPERIFASLRIPEEYVRDLWIAKNRTKESANPEPTPEQIEDEKETMRVSTRRLVGKLLEDYRNPKSPDPLDCVEVAFYDKIPEPEPIPLTTMQIIGKWLSEHWQTLGLMGLVLAGLCILWAVSRPKKPEPIVIYEAPEIPMDVFEAHAQAKADAEAAAAEEEDEFGVKRTLGGFDKSIRSLQEEIAELIEENPDAAAAVLRQWIGNAVPAENK
jgi:flagellar M-ring protein FliF